MNTTSTHEIVGVIEPGEVEQLTLRVKVIGSGVSFVTRPKDLYTKEWLPCFSAEDVAYIAFLNAASYGDGNVSIKHFPRKKHRLTESVVLITILFVCFLMMSNMTAFRISEVTLPWRILGQVATIQFPAALILFPATFAFSTIPTEVYGFHVSRLVIWGGLAANSLLVLGVWLVSLLPTSPVWAAHTGISVKAYEGLFSGYVRTFFASSIAYFFSEFLNSTLLAKLKVSNHGKRLSHRILKSTGLAVSLDSTLFCSILFWGVLSGKEILAIIAVQIAVKFTYELALLPFVIKVSSHLKKRDQIDYYDVNTIFNPFSLAE
jgi:uncharacterized integral membrane protein (TIGR00697 family)